MSIPTGLETAINSALNDTLIVAGYIVVALAIYQSFNWMIRIIQSLLAPESDNYSSDYQNEIYDGTQDPYDNFDETPEEKEERLDWMANNGMSDSMTHEERYGR